MTVVRTRDYQIQRGEVWERLIILKDKRTRRRRVPTEADATILVNSVKYILPVTITSEGGVLLSLTPNNTEWLAVGTYPWDMAANVSRSALLTSTPITQMLVVKGTLTVTDEGNLTPMTSDGVATPLVAR
jgi:hypothetical protein